MSDARPRLSCLLAFICLVALPLFAQQQPPQVPGAIRTNITMVPIDVRVLDRDGRPVTDLTRDDFVITENKVPQTIAHFSSHGLVPDEEAADDTITLNRPDAPLQQQNRRVFLLLMGRGRMTGPVKELESLQEFVRDRLLPQDVVAFAGYNRATDFTTDHAKIAGIVARYKARHTRIEAMLSQWFSGLRAVYGSKEIPKHIQAEIDAIFEEGSNLPMRSITSGQIKDSQQIRSDIRRTGDALVTSELNSRRMASTLDTVAGETANALDLSFDDYVERQTEQFQDLAALFSGIDYLRRMEGEKHVTFLTPKGLLLPRAENDRTLGAIAADARVVLNIVHTGGVVGAPPVRIGQRADGGLVMSKDAVPTPSMVFGQTFTIGALRRISDITGGQMVAFRHGRDFFSRVDESTRFGYLLGYSPTDSDLDGRFRDIVVSVRRPGVTVHYRRGYFATPQLVPVDRRTFLTFSRLNSAGMYTGPLNDIHVSMMPPVVSGSEGQLMLEVSGTIDPSRVKFTTENGRQVATLDLGIYAGDARQRIVGESLTKIDLKLMPASFEAAVKDGTPFTARIPISKRPRYVKAIVYDYGADLLGTALVRVK
jgi:VWFA-related protein